MNLEERAEKALKFLVDTDEVSADLSAVADTAEARYQEIVDAIFLHDEGSVESRKANARTDPRAVKALGEFFEAKRAYKAIENRRRTEGVVIDWLRTLAVNKRLGQ